MKNRLKELDWSSKIMEQIKINNYPDYFAFVTYEDK